MTNILSLAFLFLDLTRKGEPNKVQWTKGTKWAFQSLKATLTSWPVLRNTDFSLSFLVHTGTSEMGLGMVLSQNFDGEEDPIVFRIHKMTPAGWQDAAVVQEALAIKWTVEALCYSSQ